MMSSGSGAHAVYWQTQDNEYVNDTTLVQNTWETLNSDLSAGRPARLWYIQMTQTNDGAAAEDIEVEVTINGTATTFSASCNSGTAYYCVIGGNGNPYLVTSIATVGNPTWKVEQAVPLDCATVSLIRYRQTSDVDGVSASIVLTVVWEKLTAVS